MGARNSFGHLMPTSRASAGPWDIPRKASIWGSIAFTHKPRGCVKPWRKPGRGACSLAMHCLGAWMLLTILGPHHTQHGDVVGPSLSTDLPSSHCERCTRATTLGIRSCLSSSPSCARRTGRQGRSMACGKFSSAQTVL